MRVQPVGKYSVPQYPTAGEASGQPQLLEHVPAGWAAGSRLAALLGAGLAAPLLLGCGAAADGPASPPAKSGEAAPKSCERTSAKSSSNRVLLTVAPILEEALKNDGRGAFGCVAIDPPSFLSEEEAVVIIRRELSAAGLKLAEKGLTLDRVVKPVTSMDSPGDARGRKAEPDKPGPFEFDGASDDGAVIFEYISQQDYVLWCKRGALSSVSSYDFADAAARFAAGLHNTSTGGGGIVGVFFDPLAHTPREKPEERKADQGSSEERWKKHEAAAKAVAEERLKAQVAHFVKFLRQEGKLAREQASPQAKAPAVPPGPKDVF